MAAYNEDKGSASSFLEVINGDAVAVAMRSRGKPTVGLDGVPAHTIQSH